MNSTNFDKNQGYNVSAKYSVLNTLQIANAFADSGFELTDVRKARVKVAEKDGFQKHLLTFKKPSLQSREVGDVTPQILLTNSYDGSSSFILRLGMFRLVCANGLVVGSTFQSVRIRHVGADALQRAVQGAELIASQSGQAYEVTKRMLSHGMSDAARHDFAVQAAALVLPQNALNVQHLDMLHVRRRFDAGNDLWTIFNRVQETAIRGGLRYQSVNEQGVVRNHSTRAIKAIDRTLTVNEDLWTLAQTYLQGA